MTRQLKGVAIEFLPSLVIIGCVVALSALGAVATDTSTPWYRALLKPEWQPPAWLFAPVWTLIYILFAISAILVWNHTAGDQRLRLMVLYALNGTLNLAWTFIFFRGRSPGIALLDIIGLVLTLLVMILRVWPVSPGASLLLLPYLLWVCFASALNWAIARMN